jgi:hypothetical protein
MTDQINQDQAATAPAQPTLTLTDLSIVLNTIQAVVQRGAIRAEEMSTVGGLFDRLYAFLKAQGAITEQASPATETEPAAQ